MFCENKEHLGKCLGTYHTMRDDPKTFAFHQDNFRNNKEIREKGHLSISGTLGRFFKYNE